LWKEIAVAYFKIIPQDFPEAQSKTSKFLKNLTWAKHEAGIITNNGYISLKHKFMCDIKPGFC
jgi:hypothetical protein